MSTNTSQVDHSETFPNTKQLQPDMSAQPLHEENKKTLSTSPIHEETKETTSNSSAGSLHEEVQHGPSSISAKAGPKSRIARAGRFYQKLEQLFQDDKRDADSQRKIINKWVKLRGIHFMCAEMADHHKRQLGGTWVPKQLPKNLKKTTEKFQKCLKQLGEANDVFVEHAKHVESLGEQVKELTADNQQWERIFLLGEIMRLSVTTNELDTKCVKAKARANKWSKKRNDATEAYLTRHLDDDVLSQEFLDVHIKMQVVEQGMWKYFVGLAGEAAKKKDKTKKVKKEEREELEKLANKVKEAKKDLFAWRYWNKERVCGGTDIAECLVAHRHE